MKKTFIDMQKSFISFVLIMRIKYLVPMVVVVLACSLTANATPIDINSFGTTYTQDFNSLSNTGTSNSLPTGWALYEAGTNSFVNQDYFASDGSDNHGDVYSFGDDNTTERAFGSISSNTLSPIIGAAFANNTGEMLSALSIEYFGEQWRLGDSQRGTLDQLDFQYSFDAMSLITGAWMDFDALDFSSLVTTGTTGALDGNQAANRTNLSATITNLSLMDGASIWFRWVDDNIALADDGLALDDFSLTALRYNPSPVPEPSTLLLLSGGLVGLAFYARRRKKE